MGKSALIVWGGWDGHQPEQVGQIFERVLKEEGFAVERRDTLEAFEDPQKLASLSLIVPVWTMGSITHQQLDSVVKAVQGGVGIAGCHGGMGDSFRDATEWQFMVGGQWVAHPGNDTVRYMVNITDRSHPLTRDIADFEVTSEQYYMHIDPAIKVLATTRFPLADGPHVGNGPVDMPVVWTKQYGRGKVFYNSLGHHAATIAAEPALTLMRRGFAWAAK
jgi:type 1 glutamine amidotransferase